ncbi:MAG TPA: hypothetical protein VIK72_09495 [Clostridiaceae bacterium]
MKVVINKCFGGFGLSLKGQKRLGELQGKEIYFYKQTKYSFKEGIDEYQKVNDLEERSLFTHAVTKDFGEFITSEELNEFYYNNNNLKRNDEDLIKVVKELKAEVNGQCANLKIVEIPDGIEYEISDYDGMESVEEMHRSWG